MWQVGKQDLKCYQLKSNCPYCNKVNIKTHHYPPIPKHALWLGSPQTCPNCYFWGNDIDCWCQRVYTFAPTRKIDTAEDDASPQTNKSEMSIASKLALLYAIVKNLSEKADKKLREYYESIVDSDETWEVVRHCKERGIWTEESLKYGSINDNSIQEYHREIFGQDGGSNE